MTSSLIPHPSSLIVSSILVLALAVPAIASKAPNRTIEDIRSMRLGPSHPPTEADRDRKAALALLMTGAAHQRHDRTADALRCFERAWRLDPQSSTILHGILPLAVRLGRGTEAARWAVKVSDPTGADPKTLHYLGLQMATRGDWPNALKLYRWSLAAEADARKSAAGVMRQMELGRICWMAEKPKDAAECFAEVVLALDNPKKYGLDNVTLKKLFFAGKPGPTYQFIGECFLEADRPDDAKAAFDKAEPDEALRHYNQARLSAHAGQTAEALAALESALAERLGGEGTTPYELLAKWLDKLGKKSELIDRLEKLHAAEPDNIALSFFLAEQYQKAKQPDKAEAIYRGLLKKKPQPTAYRGLMDLYRQAGRYDALLEILGDAVEKLGILQTLQAESQTVSGDKAATAALARIARERIQNKKAPADFGRGPRTAAGLMALEAKQFDEAAESFNAALTSIRESDAETPVEPMKADSPESRLPLPGLPVQAGLPTPAAEIYMVWGLGLLGSDHAAEAAKVFQRAIDEEAYDDEAACYFYLSGALALADRYDEALAAARTAAEKKPKSARFRARPAWVSYYAKRYDEAAKAYLALVAQVDPDTSEETRDVLRDARLALSNLCVIQGDTAQAEEWLEQVLDEFPDDPGALNDLGFLWADQGKHLSRAHRMIQAAVSAEPDNAAYRDSLGWVLFQLEKYPEALAELQKATADKTPDGTVLEHLGDAYLKTHNRPKAVESWRRAAEAYRQAKETQKAQAVERKQLKIDN